MQNKVERQDEKGKSEDVIIFHEYADSSGFIIREMLETKAPGLKFQAGRYTSRPMRLPVYCGTKVKHHREGDPVQVFHLVASGQSKDEALSRASNILLRAEAAKARRAALAL